MAAESTRRVHGDRHGAWLNRGSERIEGMTSKTSGNTDGVDDPEPLHATNVGAPLGDDLCPHRNGVREQRPAWGQGTPGAVEDPAVPSRRGCAPGRRRRLRQGDEQLRPRARRRTLWSGFADRSHVASRLDRPVARAGARPTGDPREEDQRRPPAPQRSLHRRATHADQRAAGGR